MRALTSVSILALVLGHLCACSDQTNTILPQPDPPTDDAGLDPGAVDGGQGPRDAAIDKPAVPSGCPAPRILAPADVPAGFLPAAKVTYVKNPDGDTATFRWPDHLDHIVRFLYINTEEAHGAETTAFGIQTGVIVTGYLKAAKEITVVIQESSPGSGQVHLDPYARWLGLVFLDGELLETRIVREGLSAYYTPFGCAAEPIHSSLLDGEAEAWANKRGIWEAGHPTDYRVVFDDWIGNRTCRPNPYQKPYCP